MKALSLKQISKANQPGFTIVELIVVILLLGILTATALPLFMDVSDSAHDAVFDGVKGGLQTGVSLYHVQWLVDGKVLNSGITLFGGSFPSTTGYPTGDDAGESDVVIDLNDECLDVFEDVIQVGGAPQAFEDSAETTTTGVAIDQTNVNNAVTAGADFLVQFTATNLCTFAYIAQFVTIAADDIPILEYDPVTGVIVEGTPL